MESPQSRELTPIVKSGMDTFSCTANDYFDWLLKTIDKLKQTQ